ncbi:pyridoxamine kinase [Clostridium taeniosporum]|uniref:pyridoxal kinase n=1 Tax=Clostridium taeniosporum TaxID=394958 RepID=A0A1D7XN51_9CLOT|nr:pyridoxamine kinase [Clostridium taeniosporum]AOR24549.1 phosphomethylpyrimidine kinase [Clostridium taeniosporum]
MNKNKQKRIAVINDLSGFGRCSLTVALPIISAMKIQCCTLPTAILSTNTAFPNFFFDDYTNKMKNFTNHWKELNLEFDGISTGFLGSKDQIDIVIDFIKKFKTDTTKVLVDPIMGDYGKIYSTYTDEMCNEMKLLIKYADIITPNLTEACKLIDMPYPDKALDQAELEFIAKNLCENGPKKVVITGLQNDDYVQNFIYEIGKSPEIVSVKKIGKDRSGTGDVFSSILAADMINNINIVDSVKKASDFISKCIKYTSKLDISAYEGICFEEFLCEL